MLIQTEVQRGPDPTFSESIDLFNDVIEVFLSDHHNRYPTAKAIVHLVHGLDNVFVSPAS